MDFASRVRQSMRHAQAQKDTADRSENTVVKPARAAFDAYRQQVKPLGLEDLRTLKGQGLEAKPVQKPRKRRPQPTCYEFYRVLMSRAVPWRSGRYTAAESAAHSDGTLRYQTLGSEQQPEFHQLPFVINTSLNLRDKLLDKAFEVVRSVLASNVDIDAIWHDRNVNLYVRGRLP